MQRSGHHSSLRVHVGWHQKTGERGIEQSCIAIKLVPIIDNWLKWLGLLVLIDKF